VLEVIAEVGDHAVDGRPGRHHDQDSSRLFENRHQCFGRVHARDLRAFFRSFDKRLRLRRVEVVTGDGESAAFDISREIGAHDAQPDNAEVLATPGRSVRMPGSASFPSGHSASAFAFATAVGAEIPALGLPLRVLAAAVAYSRVHGGAHYPADTIAGSLIGGAAATFVTRARRRS